MIKCHFWPIQQREGQFKNTCVCPDIDCYVTALRPRQLGQGMVFCKGHSSMSGRIVAVGLLSSFNLNYPWLNYILLWLPWILNSPHYTTGEMAKMLKKMSYKISGPRKISWQVIEITTKCKRFKKVEKYLITYQSLLRSETKRMTLVKEEKETNQNIFILKQDLFF